MDNSLHLEMEPGEDISLLMKANVELVQLLVPEFTSNIEKPTWQVRQTGAWKKVQTILPKASPQAQYEPLKLCPREDIREAVNQLTDDTWEGLFAYMISMASVVILPAFATTATPHPPFISTQIAWTPKAQTPAHKASAHKPGNQAQAPESGNTSIKAFRLTPGDDLYVRFLFADGTIFCKKKDGSNTQAFTEILISKERKNSESLWARSMKNSPEYFKTILDKYFDRFHFDQEIYGVDQVLESTVQHDCANYYDVSMRDGLDAMLKWTVAEGLKERVDSILSAFVPDGRFNNFMLGSLYDAILMNNPDIMDILQAWVHCEKVESFYKDFCKDIMGSLNEGKNITDVPRKPDVLKQQHMSTSGKGEIGNIRNEISNFNRVGIDLTWLLDR
ncbi:hypothetical protein IWQ61_000724 [Dispira simplex]|nr:hypothetical protein IWQ61_000724 [Dispira simplex]